MVKLKQVFCGTPGLASQHPLWETLHYSGINPIMKIVHLSQPDTQYWTCFIFSVSSRLSVHIRVSTHLLLGTLGEAEACVTDKTIKFKTILRSSANSFFSAWWSWVWCTNSSWLCSSSLTFSKNCCSVGTRRRVGMINDKTQNTQWNVSDKRS